MSSKAGVSAGCTGQVHVARARPCQGMAQRADGQGPRVHESESRLAAPVVMPCLAGGPQGITGADDLRAGCGSPKAWQNAAVMLLPVLLPVASRGLLGSREVFPGKEDP